MNTPNLYDTSSDVDRTAAAILCGMTGQTPAFICALRAMSPIPDATIGDIARAYLRHMLGELEAAKAANAIDPPSAWADEELY